MTVIPGNGPFPLRGHSRLDREPKTDRESTPAADREAERPDAHRQDRRAKHIRQEIQTTGRTEIRRWRTQLHIPTGSQTGCQLQHTVKHCDRAQQYHPDGSGRRKIRLRYGHGRTC